jgi:ABC-type amino acid transport system permease subunit
MPSFLIIFYAFIGLPKIGIRLDSFWSATVGLTIYTSAVLAEIVRAGILSVAKGQLEAAYSLGLAPLNTIFSQLITLYQVRLSNVQKICHRRTEPPPTLLHYFSGLGISQGYLFSLCDCPPKANLARAGSLPKYGNVLETMFVIAMIYFIICYILSTISYSRRS